MANLAKHGLDFADAWWVLESRYRLDVLVEQGNEIRTQSISYVMEQLAVLSLIHLPRDESSRIVSYRHASEKESEIYREWLENQSSEA